MKKNMILLAAILLGMACHAADEVTIADIIVPQGGLAEVNICLTNPEKNYTAGQMLLVLPAGVTTVLNANNDPMVSKGERITSTNHAIGATHLEDGTDQFTIFSISSDAIPGTEGALFSVTVSVSNDLAVGTVLEGRLESIEMTTTDASPTPFNNQSFTITIGENRIVLDEASTSMPYNANNANVRVLRTLAADEWATICLPFAMTAEQVVEAFGEGVQVADFTAWSPEEDSEGNITGISLGFETVASMEANRPYLIRVAEDVAEFTLDGVDISPEDEPTVHVGKRLAERGYFVGTHVVASVPEENLFLDGGAFAYSDGTAQTKAFSAYFELAGVLTDMDTAAGCVDIVLDGENITTGISAADAKRPTTSLWYNLQGQRLSQPRKGLNITGGRKVMAK